MPPHAPRDASPPAVDLGRFLEAQAPVIERALGELRAVAKRTHWMWFVFPQLEGLGRSATARRFALGSRAEAEAYLRHPVLGGRLRECTRAVNALEGRRIGEIFAPPDDLKFHSCMTLFAHAGADNREFREALGKYFGSVEDERTLERLRAVDGPLREGREYPDDPPATPRV